MKKVLYAISPIFIIYVLFIPYSLFLQNVYMIGYSNANTFTLFFWLFVATGCTVMAFFISRDIMKNKIVLRIIYLFIIFIISFATAFLFIYYMKIK